MRSSKSVCGITSGTLAVTALPARLRPSDGAISGVRCGPDRLNRRAGHILVHTADHETAFHRQRSIELQLGLRLEWRDHAAHRLSVDGRGDLRAVVADVEAVQARGVDDEALIAYRSAGIEPAAEPGAARQPRVEPERQEVVRPLVLAEVRGGPDDLLHLPELRRRDIRHAADRIAAAARQTRIAGRVHAIQVEVGGRDQDVVRRPGTCCRCSDNSRRCCGSSRRSATGSSAARAGSPRSNPSCDP